MNLDCAFRVPRWMRDLAISPVGLVEWLQREEGASGQPVSAGAVALAKWILNDLERADAQAGSLTSPLFMGGTIRRILAGVMLPSSEFAEAIGQMTAGAVTFAAFEAPAPEAQPIEPAARAAPDEAAAQPEAPRSVLGTTPSGPLFKVTKRRGFVELDGLGITLRPSIAAAELLRDRLNAVLPARQS
jgi:hypothetical protein